MDPRPVPDPITLTAKAITDQWSRCLAHLPPDVVSALSNDMKVSSDPDPGADDGVHASFLFDGRGTAVSYRGEHTMVARRHGLPSPDASRAPQRPEDAVLGSSPT